MIFQEIKKNIISDTDFKTKLLYAQIFLCSSVAGMYLLIYFLYLQYLPPILVHILYISYVISLLIPLRSGHYLYVKYGITISHLIQLTLATFVWFPTSTGFNLYYLLVPMTAFLIFSFDIEKERISAIFLSLLSAILYFISEIFSLSFAMYPTTTETDTIFNTLTIITTLVPLTFIFTMFSYDIFSLQQKLTHLAHIDPLTNILNRRALFEEGKQAFSIAKNSSSTRQNIFSLLIFDIDHFKTVNDTYGHPVGDQLLRQLSSHISSLLPQNTLFARYGGEEFAILIKDTDEEKSLALATTLLKTIENIDFLIASYDISITVSIGITSYKPSFNSYNDMLRVADQSLYKAKENGRNQIIAS